MNKEKIEYFRKFYKDQYQKYPTNEYVTEDTYIRKPMVNRIIAQKIQNMILEDLYINTNILDGDIGEGLFYELVDNSLGWANLILGDIGVWEL